MYKIIFLFTSSIGLVTFLLLLSRAKSNEFINKYLILSFFLITVKFFLVGIRDIIFSEYFSNYDLITNLPGLLIIIMYYLYFKDLVQKKKKSRFNNSWHFIVFFLLYAITILDHQGKLNVPIEYIMVPFVICFSYYLLSSYLLLKKHLWGSSKNIVVTNKQQAVISNWTKYLFFSMVFVFIRVLVEIANYNLNSNFKHLPVFSIVPCIIASFLFIKVLMTPEILYGYTFLTDRLTEVKTTHLALPNIWIKKRITDLTNAQENSLSELVFNKLNDYISAIESIDFSKKNYQNPDFNLKDLANILAVPNSHLSFLFKHHCTLSFPEYKKVVRISQAIKLIEEGYLKSNTIESLAMNVGFSSYSPFYTSFKKITGTSPQEYTLKDNQNILTPKNSY